MGGVVGDGETGVYRLDDLQVTSVMRARGQAAHPVAEDAPPTPHTALPSNTSPVRTSFWIPSTRNRAAPSNNPTAMTSFCACTKELNSSATAAQTGQVFLTRDPM